MKNAYSVVFARPARAEIEAIETKILDRIMAKIEGLETDPRPRGCRKIRGERNLWRIRIGDYRVIYYVYDENMTVDIVAVRHRSDAYR